MKLKNKLYIMRGIPGSGKSTKAKQLRDSCGAIICSTDDYWLRPDGAYDFNPRRLKEAHAWNANRVRLYLTSPECTYNVIVDNTNTQKWEYESYLELAQEAGYDVEIVAIHGKDLSSERVLEMAERNKHGVPLEVVKKMYERFEE